ncbi:MAG: SHOCT domain-containing protein [Desulfobulbaceae bacterium]|nr:SHOCT domain-containing protein [Desulfobulbaceae bacterium]
MMHWFGDYGYGMSHGLGSIFMIVFWVLLIFLIFYIVKLLLKGGIDGRPPKNAEEILKERYAGGEINKEEYDRIKQDLRD